MLTKEEEEEQHKDAIIAFTEEVLQARDIECDSRISKISEEQLKEILEEVRQLCKKNKNSKDREQLEIARQ
jgi:ribosomal protein S13